jgi:RNA polymerase sigma-70 factor (ECF subfamily)
MTADADLVKAAVGGDRGAFASLLARHRPRATVLARRLLGDAVEADDLFQEAALQAFLALDRLRDPRRFGSWLYGIVLNLGKMRLRQRGSELSLDGVGGRRLPESIDGALGGTSPEVTLESLELLRLVREAIAVLPAGQRDVEIGRAHV